MLNITECEIMRELSNSHCALHLKLLLMQDAKKPQILDYTILSGESRFVTPYRVASIRYPEHKGQFLKLYTTANKNHH